MECRYCRSFSISSRLEIDGFSISKRKENYKSYEKDIEAINHMLPCDCSSRCRADVQCFWCQGHVVATVQQLSKCKK